MTSPSPAIASSKIGPRSRALLGFALVLAGLVALWEGYKLMGAVTDGKIPFTGFDLPVRYDDQSMPHIWQIVGSLFQPARRGGEPLAFLLAGAAAVTFLEALAGFAAGSVIGFGLGLLFVRSPLAEKGLFPWVVASQTVPLVAIAPIVVLWAGKARLPLWMPVAALAAYLSFFPVTINTVRGLRSPPPIATELFRSYAATPSGRCCSSCGFLPSSPMSGHDGRGGSRGARTRHPGERIPEDPGRPHRGRQLNAHLKGG